MKKLIAVALFGIALLWAPRAAACDYYNVVQVREVREVRKQVRVVEEVKAVKVREVREIRKVSQPSITNVEVRSGLFGLRRTNVTIVR